MTLVAGGFSIRSRCVPMGLRPSVPIWNGVRTLPSYTLFGLANVVIGARQTTG